MIYRLYNFVIRIYGLMIRWVAPINTKAHKWRKGRRHIWEEIEAVIDQLHNVIWVHAASLGEFEQGRPVIEEIKKRQPDIKIVLTFFSPSGYEIRQNYPGADYIFYLPLDTSENAEKFIGKIQPKLAIFIKYDFWFNYLKTLNQAGIPFIFISSIFTRKHYLMRSWSKRLRDILSKADCIFVQNLESQICLEEKGINSMVAGDNRVDRVIQLQKELKKYPPLDHIRSKKKIIVFGSVWPEDLEILGKWMRENKDQYFMVVAPHDISGKMQKTVLSRIKLEFTLFSELVQKSDLGYGLLVNTIGDLPHLYQYGDLAYIGGGFGKGIHSILEPIASGLPVIFGPNFEKFQEAKELIKLRAAQPIESAKAFREAVQYFESDRHEVMAQEGIQAFLNQHQGATATVVDYLVSRKYLQ